MDDLKAKSADMGGQTLAQHTWDVLERMADQMRLRPDLAGRISDRLWAQAFWGAFLHDFGKAAAGFQGVLRGEKGVWSEQKHRHEVLSLAFVEWLFPSGHPDRGAVLAIIVCHHRDAPAIFEKYGGAADMRQLNSSEDGRQEADSIRRMLADIAGNVTPEVKDQLWRWIKECAVDWAAELGFPIGEPPLLIPREQAVNTDTAKAIFRALRDFHSFHAQPSRRQRIDFALLRGLILTADHSASGGAGRFPDMPLTRAHAEKPLIGWKRRAHQAESESAPPGSAILVAPTGSGKTEAALLWAARQMEHQPACRLFYTLPYQASMNAMYTRLAVKVLGYPAEAVKSGDADGITIRHSRALLKLYQDMMELDDADPRDASKQAKWLKNKADLNTYPIQIFSPYQMLKAAYSLKGYEALLLDYTGALFIFDEIHAYEPKRLALIIELMRWLREGFGARFFVMTATLPPMLRDRLAEALAPQTITATADEFTRSQRHTVETVEGRLIDSVVERAVADYWAEKSVLVCLNRVADAQKVYQLLKAHLSADDLLLLHGRFCGRDRNRKEQKLLECVGVDTDRAERRPIICIATQVVEVSLNVDFDTLYTDPAPLEALLQRFGRVNRGRPADSPLLPVHVFTQPSAEGNKPYLPYDQTLVEDSLRVLSDYCAGRPIDEAQVTEMLGQIYSGAMLEIWERDYAASAATFREHVLGKMKPFESANDDMKKKFYEMFDGIDVLPTSLENDYYDAIEAKRFLEARQYLVNISYQTYAEFKKYGRVVEARKLEGGYADHIMVEYSDEYGLDIDGARQKQKQIRSQLVTGEEGE